MMDVGTRVAVRPDMCDIGRGKLGGRRGEVVGTGDNGWPMVRLDRVGRERRERVTGVPPMWLVYWNEDIEAQLQRMESQLGARFGEDMPGAE